MAIGGQILTQEIRMAEKSDCFTIEQAMEELHTNKPKLYNYINILGIQRIRFPFDRKTYVLKSDIARIKEHMNKIER